MRSPSRDRTARTLHATGMVLMAAVVLQLSTSFLPSIRTPGNLLLRSLSTTRLLLLPAFAAALGSAIAGRRLPDLARRARELAPLLAVSGSLLAWYVVSGWLRSPPTARMAVQLLVEEMVAMAVIILLVRDLADLRAVTAILLAGLGFAAVEAVRQFVMRQDSAYFIVRQAGWTTIHTGYAPASRIVRARGFFTNPNILGAWLAMLLPLAAVRVHRPSGVPWPPWLRFSLVIVAGLALASTFSRSSIIAAAFAGCILMLSRRPKWLLALVPIACVLLLNPMSIGRTSTMLSRIFDWRIALGVIEASPLVGIGPGNFGGYVRQVWGVDLFHAHNAFLQVTAEIGIFGGLAFVAVLALSLRQALRVRRDPRLAMYGTALAASIASVFVASLTDAAYNANPVSYTFWLLIGLIGAASTLPAEELAAPAEDGPGDGSPEHTGGDAGHPQEGTVAASAIG